MVHWFLSCAHASYGHGMAFELNPHINNHIWNINVPFGFLSLFHHLNRSDWSDCDLYSASSSTDHNHHSALCLARIYQLLSLKYLKISLLWWRFRKINHNHLRANKKHQICSVKLFLNSRFSHEEISSVYPLFIKPIKTLRISLPS